MSEITFTLSPCGEPGVLMASVECAERWRYHHARRELGGVALEYPRSRGVPFRGRPVTKENLSAFRGRMRSGKCSTSGNATNVSQRVPLSALKAILPFIIVLMSPVATWAKDLTANGLLIYREPAEDYVQAIRYFSVTPGPSGSPFVTVVRTNGASDSYAVRGIIAKLDYPPANLASVSLENAALIIRQAREMSARYPNYQAQINEIVTKWQNAEAFAKAAAEQRRLVEKAMPKLTSFLVGTTKYEDVALSAIDTDNATLSHSAGVARIRLFALSKEQIAALNSTSKSVRIDPDWKAKKELSNQKTNADSTGNLAEKPVMEGTTPAASPDIPQQDNTLKQLSESQLADEIAQLSIVVFGPDVAKAERESLTETAITGSNHPGLSQVLSNGQRRTFLATLGAAANALNVSAESLAKFVIEAQKY